MRLTASMLSPALSRGFSASRCLGGGQDRAGVGREGPKNAANGGYQAPRTRPTMVCNADSSHLLRIKPWLPAEPCLKRSAGEALLRRSRCRRGRLGSRRYAPPRCGRLSPSIIWHAALPVNFARRLATPTGVEYASTKWGPRPHDGMTQPSASADLAPKNLCRLEGSVR